MTDLVLRQDLGPVVVLTLNRPEKLNALSPELFVALARQLDTIEAAAPGCVVLAGAGRSFCAGADVEALRSSVVTDDPEFRSRTVQRLGELRCPLVAAIQGHCYTGGLELALAADIIVAAEDARFRDTHGRFGILPRWGLSARLPRRVGLAAARRMAFTGDEVGAAEALRIGLCDAIVPVADLDAHVGAMAGRIAANARTAPAVKLLYARSLDLTLAEALDEERATSPPGGGPAR